MLKMNPYVSANEKAQLIRVILMEKVLHDAIDIYASLDSTDKAFLTELRHGRTRINKAVKLRRLSLDNDADDKLLAGAAKLEPMFLARPEAKKAHKELLELQSTLPMNVEDLQDWYGFAIEFTCKNCTKADYIECPARRVLSKYEICPIDPGAKDKCQYSYAEDVVAIEPAVPGMVEKPEFAELGSVSFREHYAVKKQIEELKIKANEFENAFCKSHNQLTELKTEISNVLYPKGDAINPSIYDLIASVRDMDAQCDSLLAEKNELVASNNVFIEQLEDLCRDAEENFCKNTSRPVFLGLNNGNKLELHLPEYVTARLIEDMQRPNRLSRGICAQVIDKELTIVDMQEVVSMQIPNMPDGNWVRPQAPLYEFTTKQDRYRIDCKCGSEYFANMNAGRLTARCRDCHEKVFTDLNAEKYIEHDGKEAFPMTNKYFVSNQPRKQQEPVEEREPINGNHIPLDSKVSKAVSNLQDIKITNYGRGYKDPCQLFG